jgi:hypothetical protein
MPGPLFYDVRHHTPAGSRVIAETNLEFLRGRPRFNSAGPGTRLPVPVSRL